MANARFRRHSHYGAYCRYDNVMIYCILTFYFLAFLLMWVGEKKAVK